jgi:hypothetical protein
MQLDSKKLDRLMDEGKWEEAKALLEQSLNAIPESEVRSVNYLTFASLYARVLSNINREYAAALQDDTDALRKLRSRKGAVDDHSAIEGLRTKLKSIRTEKPTKT